MSNDRVKLSREVTRLRVARFRELQRQQILQKQRENVNETLEGEDQRDISNDRHVINEVQLETHVGEASRAHENIALHEDILSEDGALESNNELGANTDTTSEAVDERSSNSADVTNESNRDQIENNSEGSDGSNDEANPIPMDDEDSDEDENRNAEIEELREWALAMKIPHAHLNPLLGILRRRLLPDLPNTAATFLRTNDAVYDIRTIRGENNEEAGTFVYFGIKAFLMQMVNVRLHEERVLYLLINIDGLPLSKSGAMKFWPILCKVFFEPDIYKPFPAAIYAGDKTPPNLTEFFEDFITEINQLSQYGIEIEGQLFQVCIKSFICDRPARSLVKCITGHGGYYECERCTDHGERVERRTVYPAVDALRRTNASFRDQENPQHHNGVSPLLLIEPSIDMIQQFSLDFMHLCCLGIMKKMLLDFWLDSRVATFIGQNNKSKLTNSLKLLRSQVPEEFQRTTRSLELIRKWKATEFRLFLLYVGPVVLKTVLPQELYKHFLLFHSACRILCCDAWALLYNNHAMQCLETFFLLAGRLYGAQSQIMNMHSLIHLADDVVNMNCSLTQLTAFDFENALGKIKSMIRSGNRPLAQVCRRMHESFHSDYTQVSLPPIFTILRASRERPDGTQPINKLQYKGYKISKSSPNNAILLRNGKILQIYNMYKGRNDNSIKLQGFVLRIKRSIYVYPCDSSTLNMWQVTKTQVSQTCTMESIDRKVMILDLSEEAVQRIYAIAFLHL